MLQQIKAQRDLTVLITTHYMDEADKLCDRIAIVDHGKLMALDSPLKLKASIPARTARSQLLRRPAGWPSGSSAARGRDVISDDTCSASRPATARRRRWR